MDDLTVIEPRSRELSVTEVKAQVSKIQTLMADLMQEGTHYGESYPGDTKKNLLKPGADKLCFMFRLRPDFTQEIKELSDSHREVLTRCQIYHIESGQKIAEGVGLASTMESKYRWRDSRRKCPACGKETIIPGKKEWGGGWVCLSKKGGCGEKYKTDDPAITRQTIGKVENPDIADVYNTVIKISKKRAYVDATITACAASDIFTQDAEDISEKPAPAGEELAAAAATEPAPETTSSTNPVQAEERKTVLRFTAEILEHKKLDETPYFTEAEIQKEREIAKGAIGIETIRNQYKRLKEELEKRRAANEDILF